LPMLTRVTSLNIIKTDYVIALGERSKMANDTGKRYVCGTCGSEFIVTKGGSGAIACCSQPMSLKK